MQAARQLRVGAGVAGQRLVDGGGDQVRRQQGTDQGHRVVQVAAIDAIRLAVVAT
jgi:hypothetical protein